MGKPDALSRHPDHGMGTSNNADVVLLPLELFRVHTLDGLALEGEEKDILCDI